MPDALSSLLEIAGFALVVGGLWLIYAPVALIALGCGLIAAGFVGDAA